MHYEELFFVFPFDHLDIDLFTYSQKAYTP